MPPVPRKPKKIAPLIVSGPGRPAPIKKQPLPAYGPYALPLTDVEKRIVINKRTPKFVDTPSGRLATGGGGVGFFTKGDKAPIMSRVRDRAIARDADIRSRDERERVAERERLSKPAAAAPIREAVKEVKKQESKPNFLEGLAGEVGLDDFYRDNVIPVMGQAFGRFFEDTKQTYGANIVSPGVTIARGAASLIGQEDKIDEPFDYAADLVKGGVGIAKTQGFDRAKPYVKPVIEGVSKLGKGSVDAIGKADDYLQTEAPIYDSAKTWVDRNALQPSKDAATEILSRVTGQPISQRIGKADEFDRNFVFLANDITQRGAERESAAPQERRDVWIQMALGEYDDPAWDGYKSPFTREQLDRMSDYELANAAYGTHTSGIASLFEAAKNDIKKIGAMPALLGAFANQIDDANTKGDYRGLGNMAEFLVRQGVSNMVALSKANLYIVSGGQVGNYQDLVRALKAEPILTGLDVAATATIYGKAATLGLKTGGALTKAGAAASRVPGAAALGGRIARGAEAAAAIPGAGAPLRIAASTGRGLRKIADTKVIEVRDPGLASLGEVTGTTIGADRVFRPTSSFFSKASGLLRKKLYEGTNPVSRAIFGRGVTSDTSRFRAMASAMVEQMGDERAAPVVKMFKDIFDESPDLALRVMWDLTGAESITLPSGLGGRVVKLTPGGRADELELVLNGKLWVRRADGAAPDDAFRFSDESPGDGWKQVVTDDKGLPKGSSIKLGKVEVANINQNILLLRKIDDFSPDIVAKAKERLEAPYREQFGESIGKRLGARIAPEGSGSDLIQLQELSSMRNLDSLGVKIDSRVADLTPDVQSRLSSQLGIAKPTGIGRRDLAGIARLQDETIARLMPLVGNEFRVEVERILGEEVGKAQTRVEELSARLRQQENDQALDPEAEADNIVQLKAEIDLITERLGVLDAEKPERTAMTTTTASNWADEQVDHWEAYVGEIDFTGGNARAESILDETSTLPRDVVLGEKTGEATGSNTGGVSGFWMGSDGVLRYVKEYADPEQAYGELFANRIYKALGFAVPDSHLVLADGKTLIANDMVDGLTSAFGSATSDADKVYNAQSILDGVVADMWLANWDAVGVGAENIGFKNFLLPVRIDQGGALFFRAQGELKPGESIFDNFDIEDLVTQNPEYAAVIRAAGFESVKDIPGLEKQLVDIVKLVDDLGGIDKFVNKVVDEGLFPFEIGEGLKALLNSRLEELKKQIGFDSNSAGEANAIKFALREKFEEARTALGYYMMNGYKKINTALREDTVGAEGGISQSTIDNIDKLIDASPETTRPIVLFRGASKIYDHLVPGQQIEDKGFLSTSLNIKTAEWFGNVGEKNGAIVEIYVPEGTKALWGNGARYAKTNNDPKGGLDSADWGGGENEVILPRGTAFYVADVDYYANGSKIARVYAIVPGSEFSIDDLPVFGGTNQRRILQGSKGNKGVKIMESENKLLATQRLPGTRKALEEAESDYESLLAAREDIDLVAESLMRDLIESGDIPTGARVFIPTLSSPKGAKKTVFPKESLGRRGRNRDLLSIYTGQFAMLGSTEDLQRFSGALARNLRIPFVAYESVTRFTDYLMRTGTTIKFSDDAEVFAKQKEDILATSFLNDNGEINSDYVILPVDEKTGFLGKEGLDSLDFGKGAKDVGTLGRSDAGIDDAEIASIFDQALADNAVDNIEKVQPGSRVVIISRRRFDSLRKEMADAAKSPGLLRRITRQWVRFTLTTLPRTPIANVVGSGFLSGLGGGLAGYPEALRMLRRGDAPPELLSNGLAGSFNEGGDLVVAVEGGKFSGAQRYMNYVYYYNVMGEDLARLSVFVQQAKKSIKNKKARAQIDAELKEAVELGDSFQTLLEAVARGEFANGKALTPELIRIRDVALEKAEDFLGGSRGLTSGQRTITSIVPFWMWYKHIFKLYFYTLPAKYPGRALALNAMARLGAEESAKNGFYDSFYEDAVKFGEEVFGSNVYAKGLTSNIYPFNFGGALEYDEAAPGVQFALSSIAPTITLPARLAGIGVPGAPIIGAGGERLRPGDVFAPGYAEAAVSEAEKLFAPLGLIQSTVAPRSSLAFDAYRLATGQPLPEAQQRGEGEQYAVTPRGFSGLGLPQSVLEMFMRSFGLGIARTPVRGPVADRRILSEQDRLEEEARKRYRESLGLDY